MSVTRLEDTEESVVDRFSSQGTYLSQFDGGATPQGSFGYIDGPPAVNASEEVYVADGGQPRRRRVLQAGACADRDDGGGDGSGADDSDAHGQYRTHRRSGSELRVPIHGPSGGGTTVPCEPAGPFSGLNQVSAKVSGFRGKPHTATVFWAPPRKARRPVKNRRSRRWAGSCRRPTREHQAGRADRSELRDVQRRGQPQRSRNHLPLRILHRRWRKLDRARRRKRRGRLRAKCPVTQTVTGLTGTRRITCDWWRKTM